MIFFRLTMSIIRPMASQYKNIPRTRQQYPEATVSFLVGWQLDINHVFSKSK